MRIALHGKTFVPALIDMPDPDSAMSNMPSLRMKRKGVGHLISSRKGEILIVQVEFGKIISLERVE